MMFVTWDGPDVGTSQCQAKMAELATRNGRDLEGTPKITRVREVLDLAGPNAIAGQGADQVVLANALPGAHGLPNPDPRNDIPGVEPQPGGQVWRSTRSGSAWVRGGSSSPATQKTWRRCARTWASRGAIRRWTP